MSSLPQRRTHPGEPFPSPADGTVADFTPPAFRWLAVDGVASYRVVVEDERGAAIVDERAPRNALLVRRALPPGRYRWNVIADDGRARGWWRFTVPERCPTRLVPTADELLARVPATRPRYVYLPDDLAGLVARHPEQVATLKRTIDDAIARGAPQRPRFHRDPSAPDVRAAIGLSRVHVDRGLVACALGWLLLRDERAGAHAREWLLDVCDWNPAGPCAVDGPWSDEHGLSHARCLPAVFDWIHDRLSERERTLVADTIATYARQCHRRFDDERWYARPGNSHLGRMPGYLGGCALVLAGRHDDDEVRRWLERALDLLGAVHPFYGGRDGGWAEGTFYATSYAKWNLPFIFAVERLHGFSFLELPHYRNLAHFFLHFAASEWEIHPFGDGYWCRSEDAEWPGFFAQDPLSVFAERFGPPLARERAARATEPRTWWLHGFDRFRVPRAAERPELGEPASDSRAFADTGYVSMHASLADPLSTAVLARASRFGCYSHSHADQGGFAVISRGRGLLSPTGYFGNSYGTRHHLDWTRQTKAHNAILVDGEGQRWGSHETVASIVGLRDVGHAATTTLDVAGAYPQLRAYRRRILLLRPDLVIVLDDLAAGREVTIDWLAHTLSRPTIGGGAVAVERAPAAMKLALHDARGLAPTPELSDRYDVDINQGVPAHLHERWPEQFHLRWRFAPARSLRVAAVLALNGVAASTTRDRGDLVVRCAGHEVRCTLADGDPRFRVDGAIIAPADDAG